MIRAADHELPREIKRRKIYYDSFDVSIPEDIFLTIFRKVVFDELDLKQNKVEIRISRKLRPLLLVSQFWGKTAKFLIAEAINSHSKVKILFNNNKQLFFSFFKEYGHKIHSLKVGRGLLWDTLSRKETFSLFNNLTVIHLKKRHLSNNFFCKEKNTFSSVQEIKISNLYLSKRGLRNLGRIFKNIERLNIQSKLSGRDFFDTLKCQYPHLKALTMGRKTTNQQLLENQHTFDKTTFFKAHGNMTHEGLPPLINHFPNLTHIDLSEHKNLNCAELSLENDSYPQVIHFSAQNSNFSSEGIKKIASYFPNLETLKIPVENAGIKIICAEFEKLTKLCCSPNNTTNSIFATNILAKHRLEKLVVIPTSPWQLSESCVTLIATHHSNLKTIVLHDTLTVSQKWVKILRKTSPSSAAIILKN